MVDISIVIEKASWNRQTDRQTGRQVEGPDNVLSHVDALAEKWSKIYVEVEKVVVVVVVLLVLVAVVAVVMTLVSMGDGGGDEGGGGEGGGGDDESGCKIICKISLKG